MIECQCEGNDHLSVDTMVVEPRVTGGGNLDVEFIDLFVFKSGAQNDFSGPCRPGHLCDYMIESGFIGQECYACLQRAPRAFSQAVDHAAVLPWRQIDCSNTRAGSLGAKSFSQFSEHVIRGGIIRLMR